MPVITPINESTFQMQVGRDIAVLGNLDSPSCLGHIVVNRWHGGSRFTLSYPGTPSGLAMIDVPNGIIRIPYGSVSVELTGYDPSDDAPDGRIEFNVILNEKPEPDANGEYWQALDLDTMGFPAFEKIKGLDEEYDQARCAETWDHDPAPFTITPTEIRDADGQLLKSRPEHQVHSLKARALQNQHHKSVLGKNRKNGGDISYTRVSRDTLRLPRRMLVDDRGKTARIEDIIVEGNQVKFKLPAQFIKTAKYPVRHATGLDPAYTQDMDYWVTGGYDTDGTWSDYDLYTNMAVPKGAVAEIIMENVEAGVEMSLGIRTDGSSVTRLADIHECEAGGYTHLRTFVTCHATTGYVETYCEDVSDECVFYVVGYWENVTWVEESTVGSHTVDVNDTWETWTLSEGADRVHQIIMRRDFEEANICGVRAYGSSLGRKIMAHEAEGGGNTYLDLLVKADSSKRVEVWDDSCTYATKFTSWGYFGEEMDFVERWFPSMIGGGNLNTWLQWDISAQLDENGRHVDFLLMNAQPGTEYYRGVRDGDDTSMDRSLLEHEAEGVTPPEYSGFGMSAKSNSSGRVYLRAHSTNGDPYYNDFAVTGYYKPAGAEAVIQFCNDTVSLAEGLLRRMWGTYFPSDLVSIPEGWPRRMWSVRLFLDTEGVDEGIVLYKYAARLMDEAVSLGEGLVRRMWAVYLSPDPVSLVEGLVRRMWSNYLVPETVSLAEGIVRRMWGVYSKASTVAVQEGAVLYKFTLRLMDEGVNLAEGVVRRMKGNYILDEGINVVEGLVRRMWSTYLVSDTESLGEGFVRLGKVLQFCGDAVSVIEDLIRAAGFVKIMGSTVAIGEGILRRAWATYFTADTEEIVDGWLKRAWSVRVEGEDLSIVESLILAMGGKLVRMMDETVALTEGLLKRAWSVYLEAEGVSISELIMRRARIALVIPESVSIPEGLLHKIFTLKVMDEAVTLTEDVLKRLRSIRLIDEPMSMIESIVYRMWSIRVLDETEAIVDDWVKILSGFMVKVLDETINIGDDIVQAFTVFVERIFAKVRMSRRSFDNVRMRIRDFSTKLKGR